MGWKAPSANTEGEVFMGMDIAKTAATTGLSCSGTSPRSRHRFPIPMDGSVDSCWFVDIPLDRARHASTDLFSLQFARLDVYWPCELPPWADLYASPIYCKVARGRLHKSTGLIMSLNGFPLRRGSRSATGFHGLNLLHLRSVASSLGLAKWGFHHHGRDGGRTYDKSLTVYSPSFLLVF